MCEFHDSYSIKKHFLGKAPKENFFEFDLVDRISFSKLLDEVKPRTVIHLAAQAGVRLPVELTHKYVESNLTGFSNVLQSVIENRIPEFLYASSSSVYGDSTDVPYSENAVGLSPISFYGATKLTADKLFIAANNYSFDRGTTFSVVRYGNVMGSRGSVIPFFKSLKEKEIPIGAQILGVCDAACSMLEGRVYAAKKSVADVIDELQKFKGTQFAPAPTDILIEMLNNPKIVKKILAFYKEN